MKKSSQTFIANGNTTAKLDNTHNGGEGDYSSGVCTPRKWFR